MRWCLFAVLLVALTPGLAHAWADATVRSASARVLIDENAHAHVAIDATVRVEAGWLEALELDGLDAGLVLDPLDPVTMAPAPSADDLSGATEALDPLDPAVTLREDGVLVLAFTRRHAPRRGDYVVHLAYDAELASRTHADPDGVHALWTFPAWRHGLDSVRVELEAPAGAEVVLSADDEIEVARAEEGGRTRFTLTRAHLARTREWPIEVVVPEGAMAEALRFVEPESVRTTLASSAPASRPPWQGGIALALASVFVALRLFRTRRRQERERIELHPIVPLPASLRALFTLALGAALMGLALVGGDVRLLAMLAVGMLVLALSRSAPSVVPPKLGSFRHATRTLGIAASRARLWHLVGIDAWLDASALPGALVVASFAVFVLRVPREALGPALLALALVVVVALDAARLRRPLPPLVALARLTSFTRRARVSFDRPPLALMPVVHLDVQGVAQEARVRVLGALPEGTLRADVVIARTGLTGTRYALLVVVARGSHVDEALAADARFATLAIGSERVARLTSIGRDGIDGALGRLIDAGTAARPPAERDAARAAA